MNHFLPRVWLIVSCTLALSAGTIRLAWEIYVNPHIATLFAVIPAILVIAGTNALIIYLLIKPSMKKIKGLPVRIWVTVIVTAGIIASIIHYIRFIPLTEGNPPLSIIIATLLMIAAISGYMVVLWIFWFTGTKKRH